MADVKYFEDLNSLAPAPSTDDAKIIAIQTDPRNPGGGYKSTLLDTKDYVNAGKIGGKLIDGGTSTGETLDIRNNSVDNLGFTILSSGVLRSNILTYEALVLNDDDIPNKKYVDDHTSNGIWQRIGTTISVKNAGDDLDFSTAGLIQSGTFDSANISSYNTHPTFTSDTQIVDKKYVDDTAGAVVAQADVFTATGGQTIFTLSQTPSGTESTQCYINGIYYPKTTWSLVGNTFTWGGTPALIAGDTVTVQYDYQAPSIGSLDQDKMYYVGKAGSDSNNGKSVEKPFLTIAAACAAVLADGPTQNDSYAIQVIDGGIYAETGLNLPLFTTLDMSRAIFNGTITLDNGCAFHFKEIRVPASSTAITKTGAGHSAYIQGDTVSTGINATLFDVSSTSKVYAFIPHIDMSTVGSKIYNVATSAELHINSCVWNESIASTNDGTALGLLDQVSNAAFKAFTNVQHSGTGAGSTIVIQFGAESYDLEYQFDTTTNRYAAKYPGIYHYDIALWLGLLSAANNEGRLELVRRNSGGTIIETLALYNQNIGAARVASSSYFRDRWSEELKMNAGDTVEVQLTISGGASDNIQVLVTGSTFAGHLVTPTI